MSATNKEHSKVTETVTTVTRQTAEEHVQETTRVIEYS